MTVRNQRSYLMKLLIRRGANRLSKKPSRGEIKTEKKDKAKKRYLAISKKRRRKTCECCLE
jgi:hypothetical protein